MEKIYDALIIGAGPAGCSAAIWLKQLGFDVLLIDKNTECGGIQLQSIYPNTWIASSYNASTHDVAKAMHQNIVALKVEHWLETQAIKAEKKDNLFHVQLSRNGKTTAARGKLLVLAAGISKKSGGFTENDRILIGTTPKMATTDFNGKTVAILGGGDSAFENYSFFKNAGAKSATIFSRGTPRARKQMVNGVPAQDVIAGQFTADASKMTINGNPFDYIAVAFGYEVSPAALLGLSPKMKPDGYIMTNNDCETSLPGVFAIGEIALRAHPCCVTAMADGVIAAKAIQDRLEKGTEHGRV